MRPEVLTLSDPTSDLVRQYDFQILLRCRKMSHTGFVAFVRPLSEPVRRFSSCNTDCELYYDARRWEDNIKMDLQEVGGGRGD
jgi:hypothetical protein